MYSRRLEGKIALITGATGGIGEATAKRFLEEGASVMLVGRSEEKLKETRQRLYDFKNVADFVADVADESAMAAAFEATIKIFGGLDILVANAGTEGKYAPIENLKFEDFESVLRINVIGVWLSMKYAVEPMKKRGGGSIIALSSTAGMVGSATMAPYIASKHAVFGLVKTAALELAASNIRVNAIGPGSIDNRMMRSLESQFSPEDPAAWQDFVSYNIPMGRYGTNEEVANLALFLASNESTYCTGGIHMIDGGFIAG
ncbi:SDR family oxidoreductase [Flavobacterium franklandianum]|uniref:SDR family oxidoreductase n=1 Tax=Flavobacterium franklandianum TaxID=2594430 RepID=A0A553CIZ8_9FLAO|nr:SDR family NAD(P)-dependent oxidoreductase [Flavobacterium franklandianum]TRX20476.1 SDR family oxidoreductase [Flavobacterium franklandianum]TRX24811.1 SDR family oxidoreductase [Flavobacterium franklandianum]